MVHALVGYFLTVSIICAQESSEKSERSNAMFKVNLILLNSSAVGRK